VCGGLKRFPIGIVERMSLNLSNLTEAAQKKISELSNKISIQKKIIEKEQDVLKNKGDTYICSRARNACEIRKEKLANLEADFEKKRVQLEREIEMQEKIIWDETHKESPTVIRANTEIRMLKEQKDKILKAAGVFDTVEPPAKKFVNEYIAPVEEKEKHDVTSDVDFAMFMLDGRQDGKPIDPNPSWLNGVAHGLCMNSKEKKKGIKMP
jgi:hypothetical protein